MNIIKSVYKKEEPCPVEIGQIYQWVNQYYIVAKYADSTLYLINIQTGNMWSSCESANQTVATDPDFILFRGQLQINTDY